MCHRPAVCNGRLPHDRVSTHSTSSTDMHCAFMPDGPTPCAAPWQQVNWSLRRRQWVSTFLSLHAPPPLLTQSVVPAPCPHAETHCTPNLADSTPEGQSCSPLHLPACPL